jgi:hypothetical protein
MVGDGKVKSMLGGGSWKKKHEEKYVLDRYSVWK